MFKKKIAISETQLVGGFGQIVTVKYDAKAYEAGKASAEKRLDRIIKDNTGEIRRLAQTVERRDVLIALLLTLEPGLEKYRYHAEDDRIFAGVTSTQWDIEGMKAAVEFDKTRALASKYIDTDRAVTRDTRTTKKEGSK